MLFRAKNSKYREKYAGWAQSTIYATKWNIRVAFGLFTTTKEQFTPPNDTFAFAFVQFGTANDIFKPANVQFGTAKEQFAARNVKFGPANEQFGPGNVSFASANV